MLRWPQLLGQRYRSPAGGQNQESRFSFYTKTHFIDTWTSMCVSPVHKQTRNEENWSFASCFARYNVLGTVRSNIQFYNLSLYYVTKGSDTSHIFFFFEVGCFCWVRPPGFCLLLNLCQVQQMASFSSWHQTCISAGGNKHRAKYFVNLKILFFFFFEKFSRPNMGPFFSD